MSVTNYKLFLQEEASTQSVSDNSQLLNFKNGKLVINSGYKLVTGCIRDATLGFSCITKYKAKHAPVWYFGQMSPTVADVYTGKFTILKDDCNGLYTTAVMCGYQPPSASFTTIMYEASSTKRGVFYDGYISAVGTTISDTDYHVPCTPTGMASKVSELSQSNIQHSGQLTRDFFGPSGMSPVEEVFWGFPSEEDSALAGIPTQYASLNYLKRVIRYAANLFGVNISAGVGRIIWNGSSFNLDFSSSKPILNYYITTDVEQTLDYSSYQVRYDSGSCTLTSSVPYSSVPNFPNADKSYSDYVTYYRQALQSQNPQGGDVTLETIDANGWSNFTHATTTTDLFSAGGASNDPNIQPSFSTAQGKIVAGQNARLSIKSSYAKSFTGSFTDIEEGMDLTIRNPGCLDIEFDYTAICNCGQSNITVESGSNIRISAGGTHTLSIDARNAISSWAAVPEVSQASSGPFSGISTFLDSMTINLTNIHIV